MYDDIVELVDPQNKSLALKVQTFADGSYFADLKKYNYFSMILVIKGTGTLISDMSTYNIADNSLLCFSLYQPFYIKCDGEFTGMMVNFHPDFFCLHKHRNEVSCNGVLFNNNYESPVISLTRDETQALLTIINQLKCEIQRPGDTQLELLISYLKILLINASRIKIERRQANDGLTDKSPIVLNNLRQAIEDHFKSFHGPGDYAKMLNISTAALNRLSKKHFNKTLSNLISDRIIIEAKRQLYLTSQPIKSIAYELGFNDEFYFSRFFKNQVAISPQFFRDTVGFDKANA